MIKIFLNGQWKCLTQLPVDFNLGTTSVSCESCNSQQNSYILVGSCGLFYTLIKNNVNSNINNILKIFFLILLFLIIIIFICLCLFYVNKHTKHIKYYPVENINFKNDYPQSIPSAQPLQTTNENYLSSIEMGKKNQTQHNNFTDGFLIGNILNSNNHKNQVLAETILLTSRNNNNNFTNGFLVGNMLNSKNHHKHKHNKNKETHDSIGFGTTFIR